MSSLMGVEPLKWVPASVGLSPPPPVSTGPLQGSCKVCRREEVVSNVCGCSSGTCLHTKSPLAWLLSGLLASVPSTNGNGSGGLMAYSPGEQQQLPGPNSSTNSHCKSPGHARHFCMLLCSFHTPTSSVALLHGSAWSVWGLCGNRKRQRQHSA